MYFVVLAFPSMPLNGTIIDDETENGPVYASNFFIDDLVPQIEFVNNTYSPEKIVFVGPTNYTDKLVQNVKARFDIPTEQKSLGGQND